MNIKRFTLIELLIVISIIFILIAIFLMGMHRARETANKVICASNLRQLNIGYTFYAKKSNGEFPPFAWIMDPNENNTKDDKLFGGHPPQGHGAGLQSKLKGGSWIDSSMAPLMLCPSDENPELRIYSTQIKPDLIISDFNNITSYNQTKTVGSGLIEIESSYGYNLNLGLYEVQMLGLNDPSGMLVNFDADSLLGDALKQNGASKPDLTDMQNLLNNVLVERHLNQANMLFADGHVSQGNLGDINNDIVFSDNWQTTGNGYFR